jgi:hypothetical protein
MTELVVVGVGRPGITFRLIGDGEEDNVIVGVDDSCNGAA